MPSAVDGSVVEQRIVEQAVRGGVVTGWAALRLHGSAHAEGVSADGALLPVPVVADGGRVGTDRSLVVSREPLEVVQVRCGVRVVTAERALLDELRHPRLDLRDRVVVADMAFAARLTSIARMRRYLAAHRRWRRAARLDGVLDLCDERSRSPRETRLRLVWRLDAGWPHPLCNRRVLGLDGVVLATPDLLDVEHGVVGEYDGAAHRDRDRHRRDVEREDRLRRAGLEVVTVVGADLERPDVVVDRMQAARDRAQVVPRRWRLGPTPESLDQRLDHEDWLREQLEG